MNLITETVAATGVLRLAGALDIYAADRLHEALQERFGAGGELVIDLGGIESCDTAGLQLLLSARRTATAGARSLRFDSTPAAVRSCGQRLGLPDEL